MLEYSACEGLLGWRNEWAREGKRKRDNKKQRRQLKRRCNSWDLSVCYTMIPFPVHNTTRGTRIPLLRQAARWTSIGRQCCHSTCSHHQCLTPALLQPQW